MDEARQEKRFWAFEEKSYNEPWFVKKQKSAVPEMKTKGPIYRRKLSKKFLMELRTGLFLVSNCYQMIGPYEYTPAFYEYVAPPKERAAQWERIKNSGADHRMCEVYANSEEYKKMKEMLTKFYKKPFKLIICEIEKHPEGL